MTFINNCTMPSELIPLITILPALEGLAPAVLESLAQGAQQRQHRDGETLFCEGDTAHHWLLIESGCVEVVRYGHEGQELVFHCFQAGHSVAEAAMFMAHGRYPMQARAVGGTSVWRMERQMLQQACASHPALALRLLEDFSRRLYHYINEVEWLTVSSALQRLAAYLLRLAEQQGLRLELPASQRQLAAHLGIRPETLSRLLAQWQAREWLSGERRHWTLLDTSPLRRLAGALVRTF